jgi:V/A-type H+-transporting ATPase subunit E
MMMKKPEKGQEKIEKICRMIRDETLEPAEKDAQNIIEAAKKKAHEIIHEAEQQTKQMITEGQKRMEQERGVFHSSLEQASKQALESLRQSIEHKLFNEQIEKLLVEQTTDPEVIKKIIEAIVGAIDTKGLQADLEAAIPKAVSPKAINQLLATQIVKRLKDETVTVGNFAGGAQVKWVDKKMTIDLSAAALKELLVSHIGNKGIRAIFFK